MNLKEYQDELLNIYKNVSELFLRYNIKSIAHSGTLLGIVRHKNDFIPWDDDLDILVSYKDLKKNYNEIINEINSEKGKYWIFDFTDENKIISTNLLILRVYKRDYVSLNYNGQIVFKRPFIDIFLGVPHNVFKTSLGWKIHSLHHQMFWMTRKGFNRFEGTVNNKLRAFWFNLVTYPVKLIFWPESEYRRIMKIMNSTRGDFNLLHRSDCWSRRNVSYDMNKLIESNIRGIKIWINNEYSYELSRSFGNNWNKEKTSHNHSIDVKHIQHKRNIQINEFLDNLNKTYDQT